MRILYIGQLGPHETCRHRRDALAELGHEVRGVDATPSPLPSVLTKIRHRLSAGPWVGLFNLSVLAEAERWRPQVVWVDKGIYLRPSTLRRLRERHGAKLIHYNPDDPFGAFRHGWRLFRKGLPIYDLHFVPREVNRQEYRAAGARRVERFYWGFDPRLHRPLTPTPEDVQRLGGDVGFVGSYEAERAAALCEIAAAGCGVRVWGNDWERLQRPPAQLKIEGCGLLGEEYAMAACSFRINLCFLRKANRDLSTTRSVEIPACGAFMLAERTADHLHMYREGREAEFFDDPGQCIEKIRFYLANEGLRVEIAAAGRRRSVESGYDNLSRMRQLIEHVKTGGGLRRTS
jgi:spore maturation protein CgeB